MIQSHLIHTYRTFKSIFILLVVITFTTCLHSQNTEVKKVLFIGNSYTYFWNLPLTVQVLISNDSLQIDTRQSTGGGMSLRHHWNQENNLQTIDLLRKHQFDIVVLQDHSLQAINKPDSLQYYGKLFGDLIRQTGADIYLYTTWARENDPEKQKIITAEYEKLAQAIGAKIIPVGPVWEKVRSLRKDIQLYDKDGSHPSPAGTYLTACVFYKVLTGKSALGLASRIITEDKNREKLYLNIQPEHDAKFFQQVIDDMFIK